MESSAILIISADKELQEYFKNILAQKYYLLTAAELSGAVNIILIEYVDIIIVDHKLPSLNSSKLLEQLQCYGKHLEIFLAVTQDQPDIVAEALSHKVSNFLFKPFVKADILSTLSECLARKNLQLENQDLLNAVNWRYQGDFLGKGNYYNLIISKIEEYCRLPDPVLIVGEPGTEKDILAYEIYKHSKHSRGPFIKKNISRENALDDISFLYEASNGCLVLEDIAALDQDKQQKLKMLLLEKMVNVRIILLASAPISEKVKTGNYDDELYRLLANELTLLPLRERIKDLPAIIDQYLSVLNDTHNCKLTGIADEALLLLSKYSWPGNILQLRAVLYGIAQQKKAGPITIDDLPLKMLDWSTEELLRKFQKYIKVKV